MAAQYIILGLFPQQDPKPVTTRTNVLAARSACHELNRLKHAGDFEGATFRYVEFGKPFCNRCGKQNWDMSQGCFAPTSDDENWACEYGLTGQAKGVLL